MNRELCELGDISLSYPCSIGLILSIRGSYIPGKEIASRHDY